MQSRLNYELNMTWALQVKTLSIIIMITDLFNCQHLLNGLPNFPFAIFRSLKDNKNKKLLKSKFKTFNQLYFATCCVS